MSRSMGLAKGFRLRALACALLALGVIAHEPDAFAGKEMPPETPAEAVTRATPAVEAARPAKSAETPELVKEIRKAVDLMQPLVTKGAESKDFTSLWNEALTLTRFHGNQPTGKYVMEPQTAVGGYILFELPRERGWRFEGVGGERGGGEQYHVEGLRQYWGRIVHVLPDQRIASTVNLYAYDFDVIYSGIKGCNAKSLAEHEFEEVKAGFASVESRSPRILAKPMSRDFNRSHFFEAVGVDAKGQKVRRRTHFTKGSQRSYRFVVTEYRDLKDDEIPAVAWQKGTADPELEAVLDTFEEGDPRKPKKR